MEVRSRQAQRLDAAMMEAHVLLGLVLQRSGRWAEAAEAYSAGLRNQAASPRFYARLEDLLEAAHRKIPEY